MQEENQIPHESEPNAEGYRPPGTPQKIDLRGQAPRTKRVNRQALIAVFGGLAVLVVFALAAAFKTPQRTAPKSQESKQTPLPSEKLVDVPTDYEQMKRMEIEAKNRINVPKLGNPIRGELGQTQFNERNRLVANTGQPMGQSPIEKEIEAQLLEKLKRAAAARDSKVEFGTNTKVSNATAIPASSTKENFQLSQSNREHFDHSDRDTANRQDDKNEFTAKHRISDPYLTEGVLHPKNKVFLGAGTVIPALFLTGINSDLPGQVTAQVSQTIYDTVTGHYVLIPQGTTLIGMYDSHITYGQERVLLVWTRMRFPNGDSISLEGMPGTDLSGYAGVKDKVDNHWLRLISGVVLGSILGAAAEEASGTSSYSTTDPTFQQLAVSGAAENLNQAGQEITRKNLSIQPTLVIRSGQRVGVFVTKDIELAPYRG